VQLHHTFYSKKLSSFEARFLKGSEIAKWTRLCLNGSAEHELRELELLIGRGQFYNEEFIVAEREGRLIGRLRARSRAENENFFVLLESPIVVDQFEFIDVAPELVSCVVETSRLKKNIRYIQAQVSVCERHCEALLRLYQHLGFIRLDETTDEITKLRMYL